MAKQEQQDAAPSPYVQLTQDQLNGLIALAASQQNPGSELLAAVQAMKALAESTATATSGLRDEVARTTLRFNADHEHAGAFNLDPVCEFCKSGQRHPSELGGRLGHPDEPCKFSEVYFPANARIWPDQCTITEIKLLNQITKAKSCRHGLLKSVISPDGKKLFIHADVYGPDNRGNFGPFSLILSELHEGSEVVDPENLLAEVMKLRADLDAMTKKAEPVSA